MKEEEIRPQEIFNEYLRLAADDAKIFFSNVKRTHIVCPACGVQGERAFEKFGFIYEDCPDCQTLYVNPRPLASAFSKYYQESLSSKYWATTFYKETAEARREMLWKPKAKEIRNILGNYYSADLPLIVDVGGGYGLFAEEIYALLKSPPIIIEPGPYLASICRKKGFQVVEKFLEDVLFTDLPDIPKAFVSFELFEHLHDPALFMNHLYQLMSPGDLFIFTTLSGAGADIQALREDSKSVMPPHHLNFFNPHSIKLLSKVTGFEVMQATTPGKLDIDILNRNKDLIKDHFWRTFITMATEDQKIECQQWLAQQGWSSHMLVVCRKPSNLEIL
jgi:hypothetical protein